MHKGGVCMCHLLSSYESVQIKLFNNITKHTTFSVFFPTIFECFFTFTLWLHSLSRLTLELCYIKQKLKFSHFFPIFFHVVADLVVCQCMHSQSLCIYFALFSVHFFSFSFFIVGTI